MRTLDAYLSVGCSPTAAAERLHLHRNGLLYRLQRIREVLPVDLDDPERRLALHLALRIGDVLEPGWPRSRGSPELALAQVRRIACAGAGAGSADRLMRQQCSRSPEAATVQPVARGGDGAAGRPRRRRCSRSPEEAVQPVARGGGGAADRPTRRRCSRSPEPGSGRLTKAGAALTAV